MKKKKMRYSSETEKKRKSKRAVLSYEDVPLDEYDDERTQISKSAVKKILIVVAIVFVLGFVVFAVANRDNFTPEKISHWFQYDVIGTGDREYPVTLIGTGVTDQNFKSDGGVNYASDTAFVSLSASGNEVGYTQHKYANPILKQKGDKVMVYNLGGNGYALGTTEGLKKFKDTDRYIFCGDINAEGYFAVVTETDGYLAKLFVYNNDGDRIYTYSFSEYFINAIALNPNSTGCVACGITGDNGSLRGMAYVLDFGREEPVATYTLDENAVYSVEYLNSSTACIVASKSAYMVDIRGANLNQVDYSHQELTAYDINPDTNSLVLSLSRNGDGRNCSLEYVNSRGEVVNVNDTKRSVSSISMFKNRIAVLDSSTIYLYDTNSEYLGKADAGAGAKSVRLENTDSAYVLGINEVRRIGLQQQ